jgi:aminoglycoside 6'-N-acetyltransferase I
VLIAPLDADDRTALARCAQLLVDEFRTLAPDAWPTLDHARETVDECTAAGPVLVARDDDAIVGWIGGRPTYGRVWELHPLVVAGAHQRRGIGRALVAAIERAVAERGALTLVLGSDDEVGLTSLYGVDLYPDPLVHLERLTERGGHPTVFYRKCGFAVVGVTPDASGLGKPDIHMAKRVGG